MHLIRILVVVAMLLTAPIFAPSARGEGCEEAMTIFTDVAVSGRRDKASDNMTKRHREMAAQGWRFADMEVYLENNDLEGFYITYVRTVACGVKPE